MKPIFSTIAFVVLAALGISTPAYPTSHDSTQAKTQAQASVTDGEVRKVDKETKKITIRHGPIANLDMPAMTMVFQVSDPAILEQVKAGDKIKFSADKVGGAYTVTRIEAGK